MGTINTNYLKVYLGMIWNEFALGNAIHIKHGYAFKGEFFSDKGDYIVLTPGNFFEEGGFRIRPDKERYYTSDFPKAFILEKGSLIIAMTEQGPGLLGSSALIPSENRYLHNQRLGLVDHIDTNLLDKLFLYFLFNSSLVRNQINASASGTKVRHTAPERIYRVMVRAPDVKTQAKIAEILLSYDHLIKTNQRRIQLLEESARLLYREWFVNLRFPGHETVPIKDGVPEGWRKANLFEVCDVTYGYPFKANLFNCEGIGTQIIRIRDIPEMKSNTYTIEEIDESYLVRRGDLLIGMDGIFHMNNWAGKTGYLVQRVCKFRPKVEILLAFVSLALIEPIKYYESTIQGATVAHLGTKHLKEINLLIPRGLDVCLKYLNDLLWQRIYLHEMNMQLAQSRDLLLPKLMSGALDVSQIRSIA